jgi:hypothetical protein
MLVGFLVASFLLLALISWGRKRAKFRLPGAGPYIPFIGHYEVNTILPLALISWGRKRAKFRLPGAGPYIPFIGHYEVPTSSSPGPRLMGKEEGQVYAATQKLKLVPCYIEGIIWY